MDSNSLNKPLLLSDRVELDQAKKSSFLVSSLKWTLKIVMWMIFIVWVGLIFLYPGEIGSKLIEKIINATNGSIFGITGSLFLVFSAPILIIAFLAAGHLIISGEDVFEKRKTSKSPRYRLWTFPVLVDGIFGVVSAAELIGIILFVLFIVWASYAYTLRNLDFMSELDTHKETSVVMLELTGLRLGMMGLLCLAFLFLPVSRGSLLLRLVDIPFEHATKYHVWLGHLTMMLFTLHGLFFVIGWAMEGNLMKELMEWKRIGIANLPGVISLLAGLFMWVTSLHPVRKNYFELFFYTHQLYVIFVVFLALHVGEFVFSITAGGIFIFMLDRFLRFCQSRRTVRVLSAKCLPCGTVELVLSKPQNLRYNALSFIFLQVRELSWLQWHPFSVSSSPLDGKYHLSVLIKVLGEWTAKLRDTILRASETGPQETKTTITASVEGPYGHESPYHLMYENLILVAGGIGISPFLAILCDILHRVRGGKPCLPRKVLIVWAVKKSDELPLLSTIDMESICPSFSDKVNIETNVYVTRESQPSLEEGKVHVASNSSACPLSGCGMSVLVGTGNNIWSGLYVLVSTIGFIVLMVLLRIFYINPYNITTWWYQALLYILCMVGGVIIFGGFVISLWNLWDKKVSAKDEHEQDDRIKIESDQRNGTVPKKDLNQHIQSSTTIQYGTRPDFREIFGTVSKKWGNVDVGVILCGPPTLQSSVAKEIRSHNITRQRQDAIFHFNSHSFDL